MYSLSLIHILYENHAMPVFYRDVMYREGVEGKDEAYLKLYDGHDWKWFCIRLEHTDMELSLIHISIGCVIVHEGKIIARGYNRRNTDKNTLSQDVYKRQVIIK